MDEAPVDGELEGAVEEGKSEPNAAPEEHDSQPNGVAPKDVDPELQAERERLAAERRVRRDAALRFVRKWGDPVLKSRAGPVERFDETLQAEIERMARIMEEGMGIGLAATQLGVLHRVLVYRIEPDAPIAALVNPELEWSGDEHQEAEEGCLSLPGVLIDVERPVHVRVRGQDAAGEDLLIEASGLEARVLQHEIDHLDGVLILDRADRAQRKEAIRALRERERDPTGAGV